MLLHFGSKVPKFLTERMGLMGDAIVESIVDNYGKSEVLTRMSDPNSFQARRRNGHALELFWCYRHGVGRVKAQNQSKSP